MILEPKGYKHLLKSVVPGSWGRLDFENSMVSVRVMDIRTIDGSLRVYFGHDREQVMSGQRYHPMSRVPWGMGPGYVYRLDSQIELVKEIPEGMKVQLVIDPEIAASGAFVTPLTLAPGWRGRVSMCIMVTRPTTFDSMVKIGGLLFEQDVKPAVPKNKAPAKKKAPAKAKAEA